MILPGISSHESIVLSHCLPSPEGRKAGDWENNVGRLDINEMGEKVGVDFIVNVVHNVQGEIVAVAAGHQINAWASLIPTCREMYIRSAIKPADIHYQRGHGIPVGAFATTHLGVAGGTTQQARWHDDHCPEGWPQHQ
jgi:nickel-dependent lactate racemase